MNPHIQWPAEPPRESHRGLLRFVLTLLVWALLCVEPIGSIKPVSEGLFSYLCAVLGVALGILALIVGGLFALWGMLGFPGLADILKALFNCKD